MTHVENLIARAREKGLELAVAGAKLRVVAPKDRDAELNALLDELQQHKAELVAILAEPGPKCFDCGSPTDRVTDIYGRRWWACWGCARTA